MTARQLRAAEAKLSGIDQELESAKREIEMFRAVAEASSGRSHETAEHSLGKIRELEERLTILGDESKRLTEEIVRCSSKDSVAQLVMNYYGISSNAFRKSLCRLKNIS